jgi:DNA-binding LacI/PurR family transcriptional regulator
MGPGRLASAGRGVHVLRVDLAFDPAAAAHIAESWARGPRPGAVFAYNDEYAMLLLRALLDAGLRVPADVAVVGADDLPLCELLRPRLTSVHLEAISSARSVAETLDGMIKGTLRTVPPVPLLQPRIVARESA